MYALYVCLICKPALYVCLTSTPYVYALYARLICVQAWTESCVLHVCLIRTPYMCALYVRRHGRQAVSVERGRSTLCRSVRAHGLNFFFENMYIFFKICVCGTRQETLCRSVRARGLDLSLIFFTKKKVRKLLNLVHSRTHGLSFFLQKQSKISEFSM